MCHVLVKTAAEFACGTFKTREQIVTKIKETTLPEKCKAVSITSENYEGVHSCSFLCTSWWAKYHSVAH